MMRHLVFSLDSPTLPVGPPSHHPIHHSSHLFLLVTHEAEHLPLWKKTVVPTVLRPLPKQQHSQQKKHVLTIVRSKILQSQELLGFLV
uniref:Uncharacterized protein n=1 Tax=Arundo donax TaxID=35708 RepID=A0A0A9EKN4_ARUDO